MAGGCQYVHEQSELAERNEILSAVADLADANERKAQRLQDVLDELQGVRTIYVCVLIYSWVWVCGRCPCVVAVGWTVCFMYFCVYVCACVIRACVCLCVSACRCLCERVRIRFQGYTTILGIRVCVCRCV